MNTIQWFKSLFKKKQHQPVNNNIYHPNFANVPMTNGEVRCARTGQAIDWSSRDCLISALRDIDSGLIQSEKCLIVFDDSRTGNIHRYYAGDRLHSLALASYHIANYG